MRVLDLGGDLVGEEARDERRHGRHDEDRAGGEPEARHDGEHPEQHVQRRLHARAGDALDILRAFGGKPGEQPLQPEAEHDEQQDREPDRFPQHRAERRREHLAECLEGGVEHAARSSGAGRPAQASTRAGTDQVQAIAERRRRRIPGCGTSVASSAATDGGASSAGGSGRSAQCSRV